MSIFLGKNHLASCLSVLMLLLKGKTFSLTLALLGGLSSTFLLLLLWLLLL